MICQGINKSFGCCKLEMESSFAALRFLRTRILVGYSVWRRIETVEDKPKAPTRLHAVARRNRGMGIRYARQRTRLHGRSCPIRSVPDALSRPDVEMVAIDYFRRLGHDNHRLRFVISNEAGRFSSCLFARAKRQACAVRNLS